jgi:pyruvate,orthophosphate dikinase
MEFTIEEGKLYLLQTRNGKRTAAASIKFAVDFVNEGLLTEEEALLIIEPASLDQLLHKQLDPKSKAKAVQITSGLPASPGGAVGRIVFDAHDAYEWARGEVEGEPGEPVILTRMETSPEDLIGMNAA